MAKTAKIETKLTGDATGLRRELDVSRSDVARYARDVTARLKAIQAAVQSVNLIAGVAGFVAIAKQAIQLYGDLRKWIRGSSEEAERAAAAATEAARKLRDEAGEGVGVALYDALREQAEAAGVAADALSAKLREFREHKITFDELAASVGATRDALAGAESAAAGRTVGTRYLVEKGDAEAARKAREDAADVEREGLRAIVRDIARLADKFGNGGPEVAALWDRLMEAAGGDAARAAEIYNANRSRFGRAVGVRGYGMAALGLGGDGGLLSAGMAPISRDPMASASGRYAARQAAAEAAREAERQAHDAEVRARREAAAKAEDERRRLENERAAAAAEAERQRAEAQRQREEAARQREEAAAQAKADKIEKLEGRVVEARWRGQRAEEAIRVAAPSAINSLNAIGGLVGADPAALNAARMEAERTAAVNAIRESTAAAVRALEEEIRILREG